MVESDFNGLKIGQEVWYRDRASIVMGLLWSIDNGKHSKDIMLSEIAGGQHLAFTKIMKELRFEPPGLPEISARLRRLEELVKIHLPYSGEKKVDEPGGRFIPPK